MNMTVGELREALAKLPSDIPVVVTMEYPIQGGYDSIIENIEGVVAYDPGDPSDPGPVCLEIIIPKFE